MDDSVTSRITRQRKTSTSIGEDHVISTCSSSYWENVLQKIQCIDSKEWGALVQLDTQDPISSASLPTLSAHLNTSKAGSEHFCMTSCYETHEKLCCLYCVSKHLRMDTLPTEHSLAFLQPLPFWHQPKKMEALPGNMGLPVPPI